MSRSRPYLRNMPACWPSSGIAPSQLPRIGERIRLRQVDQNFDHIDVGHVALSPRVDAPLLDERRDESDLAREFAAAKRGGTHQDRLPDLDLPKIALI